MSIILEDQIMEWAAENYADSFTASCVVECGISFVRALDFDSWEDFESYVEANDDRNDDICNFEY